METKINIAKILKNKPQGTKLYDWLHNIDVELDTISVTNIETVVWCRDITNSNTTCRRCYSELGTECGYPDGLQFLFPSRDMRNWRKFSWKKGDILVSNDGGTEVIFDKWYDDTYTSFYGKHYLNSEDENNIKYNEAFLCSTERYSLESENAAQTYINTIEERLGGKLNRETLEIEKSPSFNDGDIVTIMPHIGDKLIYLFKAEDDEKYYGHAFLDGNIAIVNDDSYCQKDFCTARPSTEEEKSLLFNGLAKKNKAWDAEKKMIVDLKTKYEFKPMDLCLMKYIGQYNNRGWELCQYAYTEHRVSSSGEQRDFYHSVGGEIYAECIPYNEDTKHLLGTRAKWKGSKQ